MSRPPMSDMGNSLSVLGKPNPTSLAPEQREAAP